MARQRSKRECHACIPCAAGASDDKNLQDVQAPTPRTAAALPLLEHS